MSSPLARRKIESKYAREDIADRKIDTIAIVTRGNYSADVLAKLILNERQSVNYIIGNDGEICSQVCECHSASTKYGKLFDSRTIHILASDLLDKSDALDSFVTLCWDICKRHGKTKIENVLRANVPPDNTLNLIFKSDYFFDDRRHITKEINDMLMNQNTVDAPGLAEALPFAPARDGEAWTPQEPQEPQLPHVPNHAKIATLSGTTQRAFVADSGDMQRAFAVDEITTGKVLYSVLISIPRNRSLVHFQKICKSLNLHTGILIDGLYCVKQLNDLKSANILLESFRRYGYDGLVREDFIYG